MLPADLPRPPEANKTRLIAGLRLLGSDGRLGFDLKLSHLSDEAWLAHLETMGIDTNGLLAHYAAAQGAEWLGASSSTSGGGSHRGGRRNRGGKKGKWA